MRREVLRLENISKNVEGECLLSGVNLSVYYSTFHCLLIPNFNSRMCLANLLRGVMTADSGFLYVNDKMVAATQLRKNGVACIFKKSSLISQISIAENIFLTDNPYYWHGLTRLKLMSHIAGHLLEESGIHHVEALHPADSLNTYDAHKIEIVSAVSKGAQILCLDNVAEQYTDHEMSDLWQFIDYLIKTGITVIMTSPKYNFFFDHAHYTTIVNHGTPVITLPIPYNRREQLLNYLHVSEPTVIEKQNIESQRIMHFCGQTPLGRNFDISVHQGEIVGIYDEDRSVTDSLIDALNGRGKRNTELAINEQPTVIDSIQTSIKKGVVLIHEGSEYSQIFSNMSLSQNIIVTMGTPLYNRLGLRSRVVEQFIVRHTLQMLRCDYLIDRYGKNKSLPLLPWHEQMKIIVARWLCCKPQVFVFINPLLNYDDVTAHEFYTLITILKDNGYGVLIISPSLAELRRLIGS